MTNRRWAIILASIILITAGRIAATYRIFSQTVDEPIHVAGGYDFLKTGRQTSDPALGGALTANRSRTFEVHPGYRFLRG